MAKGVKTPKVAANDLIAKIFGENVFSLDVMEKRLSPKAFKSIENTVQTGGKLDPAIAQEVADAMKKWALEKGATHFCHWFQPLTGTTAEKHEAFVDPNNRGSAVSSFSAKELIQGEPDASSFPSGGLRSTFEARGYTGWDPSSPAFIKETTKGATLCIPTFFIGWHGEALDKKTPLLRSMKALSKQVCRLAELLGIETKGKRAYATLGGEEEYFLIDRDFYYQRIDLIQTGHTLFGKAPAKHQQMADHYFGPIKTRIFEYMEDMDRELWKAGIPGRTRHNEVAPSQYEIAPVFEELNLGVDHNMLAMEIMQRVAEKHDLACLLHEKPFAHINGSGKHNNWSIVGPDSKNWLSPGQNPHENERFLLTLCAVIKAVDKYADVLRASVASAGNDHRLGSHEAPPAIISIFLGDQLTDIVEQIERGDLKETKKGGTLHLGVDSLPDLPRDATDRNRTSPFAFTGAKFEFRAVGSNFSLAGPNIVLNAIVADAICDICDQLEVDKKAKKDFNVSVEKVIRDIIKKHKRVIYNGDNYTAEWIKEAERRGLPNLKNTPAALEALATEKAIQLFEKHGVLSKRELNSRYEIYKETYETTLTYEANLAVDMVRTMYLPAVSRYMKSLAGTIQSVEAADIKAAAVKKVLAEVTKLYTEGLEAVEKLEKAVADGKSGLEKRELMDALRVVIDSLEAYVPKDLWPVPSYAEMLFVL